MIKLVNHHPNQKHAVAPSYAKPEATGIRKPAKLAPLPWRFWLALIWLVIGFPVTLASLAGILLIA